MKKELSIIALMGIVGMANAQVEVNPEKVYVYGAATVNGTECTWAEPVGFDVTDNEVTLVFNDAVPGNGLSVSTQPAEGEDYANFNSHRIAPASMTDFNPEGQEITTGGDLQIPKMYSYNTDWTVKFVFGESPKAYVSTTLPKELYVTGWGATVNGNTLAWNADQNPAIEPVDGYFTATIEGWNGQFAITTTNVEADFGAYTIHPANINNAVDGRPMPLLEDFNRPQAISIYQNWLYAPYIDGSFIVKVKQDLSTIEYMVDPASTRKVQVEVRDYGFYPEEDAIHVYDMTTDDGIHYSMEIDAQKAIPAGSVVSVVTTTKNGVQTVWRADSDITFGEEKSWSTKAGDTPSTVTSTFTGKITATIPGMTYFKGEGNLYWAEEPNCPVMFEYVPTSTVGIIGIDADNNAPVEYYNLQGLRVANPENGVFIRRQGNKTEKVIIKSAY